VFFRGFFFFFFFFFDASQNSKPSVEAALCAVFSPGDFGSVASNKMRSQALTLALLAPCQCLYGGGGVRVLHNGDRYLPPLVEVPGAGLPLERIVKPPDAEALWEWSCEQRQGAGSDMDFTWASVWPTAAALAGWLVEASQRHLVQGQRVVELGCGLGVAGLSASAAGASRVTLVDREALALHCAMSTAGMPRFQQNQ